MGVLYLWGRHLGRTTFAPVSLAAAAIVMTALNPHTLWDVGFQLSFAATIGLVIYTEPLERAFERALARITSAERARQIVGLISEALIVTMAAQITTTPIILAAFGRLSLVTLTHWPAQRAAAYPARDGQLVVLSLQDRTHRIHQAHRGTFWAAIADGDRLHTVGCEDGLLKTWGGAAGKLLSTIVAPPAPM